VAALLLELLDEAWRDLLFHNSKALAFALGALHYVLWVVGPRASTVRTDGFAVVSDFVLLANVQLLKRDVDFQIHRGADLLLLLATDTC
jgi:hypothetical protein